MSKTTTRYAKVFEEFDALLAFAIASVETQAGFEPLDERQYVAERIFGKLICHGLTLKRVSPSPVPTTGELWDISSQYAVARCLIETYEALAYIALEDIPAEERSFRTLLWKLHAEERRLRMLELIKSNDPKVEGVIAQVSSLRKEILNHPLLMSLEASFQNKIKRGETPPFHLTGKDRDQRNEICHNYHKTITMHLSSHVHTHPFSVYQLYNFSAGDEECLALMSVAMQYATGFLAKSIAGFSMVFAPRLPDLDSNLQEVLERWIWILQQGAKCEG